MPLSDLQQSSNSSVSQTCIAFQKRSFLTPFANAANGGFEPNLLIFCIAANVSYCRAIKRRSCRLPHLNKDLNQDSLLIDIQATIDHMLYCTDVADLGVAEIEQSKRC